MDNEKIDMKIAVVEAQKELNKKQYALMQKEYDDQISALIKKKAVV